jgi:hypothetical protein
MNTLRMFCFSTGAVAALLAGGATARFALDPAEQSLARASLAKAPSLAINAPEYQPPRSGLADEPSPAAVPVRRIPVAIGLRPASPNQASGEQDDPSSAADDSASPSAAVDIAQDDPPAPPEPAAAQAGDQTVADPL